MGILISIVLSIVALALVEYAGHRWLLHRKSSGFGRDHIQHHKIFSLRFTDAPEEPAWYDPVWIRGLFALVWSSVAMAPVAVWISLPAALVFVGLSTTHGAVWQFIHNEMHRPTWGWLQRRAFFQFIREHHALHHHYPRTNYSFLFAPFCDRLFGTVAIPPSARG